MEIDDDRHYRPKCAQQHPGRSLYQSASAAQHPRHNGTDRDSRFPDANYSTRRSGERLNGRKRRRDSKVSAIETDGIRRLDSPNARRYCHLHKPEAVDGSDSKHNTVKVTTSNTQENAVVGAIERQTTAEQPLNNRLHEKPRTKCTEASFGLGTERYQSQVGRKSPDTYDCVYSSAVVESTSSAQSTGSLRSDVIPTSTSSTSIRNTIGSVPITYGPDARLIGKELSRYVVALREDKIAQQEREYGLARKRHEQTTERYIGEIVHIPAEEKINGSIVCNHFDFATSEAYEHPAVIVHMTEDVLTCLKLTTMPILKRWFHQFGPTAGSTFRALLYVPIHHRRGDGHNVRAVYEVPLLKQDSHQRSLKFPSSINTERVFEIEREHVRTYCTGDKADFRNWRRDKCRSFGFSLNLQSLQDLGAYLLETPSLRHFSREEDGSQRIQRVDLTPAGVKWLCRYIRSPDAALIFDKYLWREWLRTSKVAWWEAVKPSNAAVDVR